MPTTPRERRTLVLVGRAIRNYRIKAELTQEALAYKVNVHPTYLSGVENGKRNPTFVMIDRLLSATGRSWGDLSRDLARAMRRES